MMFVAPYDGPGQSGPMILDPSGGLIWFKALPKYTSATNLRVQEYAGKPVLTWWQGDISVHGFGQGEDVILDSAYAPIARVRAGNGLQADLHEFQLTPQGTALITAYDPIYCNLSKVGGSADGAVTDGTFQEIDVRTGLVMYQWTSLDHVALAESYAPANTSEHGVPVRLLPHQLDQPRPGRKPVDLRAQHVDRLRPQRADRTDQLAAGGQALELYAGAGGRHRLAARPARARRSGPSASSTTEPPRRCTASRAGSSSSLEPQGKTATLVSQFTHPPPILTQSQGNIQAQVNGDWFVGWGEVPDFSEFGPTGQLLFDAHFPAGDQSYRDLRFTWTGTPFTRPALAVVVAGGAARARSAGTVYASWNGATLVASWRVFVGATSRSLKPVAQAARSGFQTAILLPAGAAGKFVTVQALGAGGQVLGGSAPVAVSGL